MISVTDISMKWSRAVFHNYFQDGFSLLSCFVFHESFFPPPISDQWISYRYDTWWVRCMFLFGWIRFKMIWGGFWMATSPRIFLGRPIKSNWSHSEDAYLPYLSLPPGKVAPLFPTWGWMRGVIMQDQVQILPSTGGMTWLGIDSINFSREWQN